jgi:hypothetical protein
LKNKLRKELQYLLTKTLQPVSSNHQLYAQRVIKLCSQNELGAKPAADQRPTLPAQQKTGGMN